MSELPSHVPARLTVVLADDHPFYRDGLARLLRDNGIDVLAEVPNGKAAIAAVEELRPDVVVMDLNMPELSGTAAIQALIERRPDIRVLVLTVSMDEADVTAAIFAGATGYVLKDAPVQEVVAGIRAASAGESVISPRIATQLLRRIQLAVQNDLARPEPDLSPRELEVLSMLAGGLANKEIADHLYLSPSTVRHHISSILEKLQVDNRVRAAVRAVRDGLV